MAIDNIPIEISENTQEVVLDIDDTSHPYYVGARAYVTQIAEGAIVTVIDKFGRTEATLLDGNYGNITDISYDPDTKTLKKVNGVVIDDVVTLSDVAISNDYEDLDNLPDIDDIIDAHPITNVQDGAISEEALSDELKAEAINDYVTPEMFGAKGDGVTDDTSAFQSALSSGKHVKCVRGKTYLTHGNMRVTANTIIDLNESTLVCTTYRVLLNYTSEDTFLQYNGNGNITIRNGDIVGGCISFAHAKNVLFENLRFNDGILNHFVEICACKNFHIRNCYFGALYNTDYTNEHVNIDPCNQTAAPTLNILSCDGTVNDGVYVENNVFERLDGYMYDAVGVHYVPDTTKIHTNIHICNNIIRDAEKWGVSIWGCSNSIVKDNDITCNEYGIRCGLGDSNIIEGNVFYSTKKWNLISFSTSTFETNLTVVNNVLNHASRQLFASIPTGTTLKRVCGGNVPLLSWSDHKTEGEAITLAFPINIFDSISFYCGTNSGGAAGLPAGASFIEIPVRYLAMGHYTVLTWSYAAQLQSVSVQADTSDYKNLTVVKVNVQSGGGIRSIDGR